MTRILIYQFGTALRLIWTGLIGWFLIPFNRRVRHQINDCGGILKNPFYAIRMPLSELVGSELVVTVGPLGASEHNASEFELLCLASLCAQMRCRMVFEIGTYDGRSTRALAMNVEPNGRVITLNLPPGADSNDIGESNVDTLLNQKVESGWRFKNTREEPHIEQMFGDSAKFDFSPFFGTADMVFVDGSHTEAYVEKDTQTALKLVKDSGGLVVWHDAPLYGVAPYLKKRKREEGWPLHLIRGTTLMIAWVKNSQFVELPLPLPENYPTELLPS